jgi:uncharacterized protein (TIGR02300 family)
MAKPELGSKRVCVACNTRFYDLGKAPAICPKCGTEQPVEQPRVRRPSGNLADMKPIKKPQPAPGVDDADLVVADDVEDEAEDDVLEDASDLEDDADPIGPEIEVETDSDDTER